MIAVERPLLGARESADGTASVPGPGGPTVLTDLPRLVTTRSGAYSSVPSVTGTRYIAAL